MVLNTQAPAFRTARMLLLMIFLALLLAWIAPFTIIPAGHRGVVTFFGAVEDRVLGEGVHLVMPVAERVHKINVQIQKVEGTGEAASRDLQQVHSTVALNYHLNPAQVNLVYRDIGDDVDERIILPTLKEGVKAVMARYSAEELVTKRDEVRDQIRRLLASRLGRHGVVVDEFSIVNFQFSRSFNEAIEAKTTAEQLKLKAERDLQRIRIEAQQRVARAEAEARALELQKAQVSEELIRLREVENQRAAIEKWDGRLPNVSGGALPFIQLPQK